jgi:hypothetical protein
MLDLPQHSKVGFSSRKRWKNCPGSIRLSVGVPKSSSPYAEEGTLAHAIQEHCLTNHVAPTSLAGWPFSYDDHGVAKSAMPDREMLGHIQSVIDAIALDLAQDKDAVMLVEERFHLHQLHSDLFGTGDVVIWFPTLKKLQVRDLKYGAGVAVDVQDDAGEANEQLEGYALGALLAHPEWRPIEVELVIDQPRAFHSDGPTRRKTLPVGYFVDMAADLVDEVKATEQPDAPLNAGEWCRFCPAAAICPEVKAKAQEKAKQVFAKGEPYDAKELAATLDWLPILEGWIKNVREFAYAEAERGHTPPTYKLVEKVARRKWREDESVIVSRVIENTGLTRDELYDPPSIKSPAVIEKLLPKEQRAILEPLCAKESSGHTLVHESDKRPAISVDAKSAFINS